MRFKIIFLVCMICILLMSPVMVSAEKITVTEKHIIGNNGSPGTVGGPLFILTTGYEDYLVTFSTYYKVHRYDTIDLTGPDKHGQWELVGTNPSELWL